MEVSGKKLLSEQDNVLCKPCEDRDCYTRADGFCGECEVYICNKCFDAHKLFKVCRDHTLTNVKEAAVKKEQTEDLEKCERHYKKTIKFYCPQHEQVGCGDCMILEHKTCKVEYIRDKASTYKDSKEFKDLVRGADKCRVEAKEMISSIKNNKIQVKEIHEKFIQDVNRFKDEMIAHITEVTNTVLKLGENVKTKDIKSMDQLEKENEKLMNEISQLTSEIEAQIDKPNKLFVNAILQKPKNEKLRGQLEKIGKKNKIEMYEFKRDENIERSIRECKQLGTLKIIMQKKETELHVEEVRPKKTMQMRQASVPPKPQPLLDRQLICRNITVDGDCLSYVDNGKGDDGLYVDKKKMMFEGYVELEIVNMGERGTIDIGVVNKSQEWFWRFNICDGKDVMFFWSFGINDYNTFSAENWIPLKPLLGGVGDVALSIISHEKIYYFGSHRENTRQICSVGDRIGCGLTKGGFGRVYYDVFFTRNGKKIGSDVISSGYSYYAAVGLHSAGEQVRVILDAKMPNV